MTGGWEERWHPLREEWLIVAAAEEAVARIAAQYAAETGRAIKLFSGSSPGAASFGVLRLAMD